MLLHIKTRLSFKYFVNDCLRKPFFDPNSLHILTNLTSLIILAILRPLHSLNLKLEQLICKKVLKFAFLGNCFPNLFSEFKICNYTNSKFVWSQEFLVPNLHAKMKLWLTPAKNSWKTEIKLFPQCAILLEN